MSVVLKLFGTNFSQMPMEMWTVRETRRPSLAKDPRVGDAKIMEVTYGVVYKDRVPSDVKCLMREDTLRSLRDGTFIMMPAANKGGFVIADSITKLQTPMIVTRKGVIY